METNVGERRLNNSGKPIHYNSQELLKFTDNTKRENGETCRLDPKEIWLKEIK